MGNHPFQGSLDFAVEGEIFVRQPGRRTVNKKAMPAIGEHDLSIP